MKKIIWLLISLVVIILDQATKIWVTQTMTLGESIRVTNFFNWVYARNYGAAFSFLDISGGAQRWLFSSISLVVSVVLLVWLLRLKQQERWQACSLALILGGALANFWDRCMVGSVVDFLDFHIGNYHWPAFNVADSAVCVGAAMLMIHLFRQKSA